MNNAGVGPVHPSSLIPHPCPRCPVSPTARCRGLDVRRLCDLIDPACPSYDLRYVAVILAQSAGTDRPAQPAAETVELARRMNRCPFRSTGAAGCGCGRCGLRGGAVVSHLECFDCLRRFE
jgi:hypothetical protein